MGPRPHFRHVPEGKAAKNRLHLDVRVGTGLVGPERLAALEAERARLVPLGAVHVRTLYDGHDACIPMLDIEGNEFRIDQGDTMNPTGTPARHLGEAARVTLRHLRRQDHAEIAALTRESTELHRPWLGVHALTAEAFERRLERFARPTHEGFVICLRETGAIVGGVNVNDILRGSRQCGTLGFTAYAATTGRGYLTEGLGLVIRYAFGPLGLHRLEANIQPGNTRSLALVRRLGFRYEGFSPAFQQIDGEWRDHERWALVSGDAGQAGPADGEHRPR